MAGEFRVVRNIDGARVLIDKDLEWSIGSGRIVFKALVDGTCELVHHFSMPVNQSMVDKASRRYAALIHCHSIDTSDLPFHERLKHHRCRLRLNPSQVAQAIKMSTRHYRRCESGEAVPSANTFLKLMDALGIKHSF